MLCARAVQLQSMPVPCIHQATVLQCDASICDLCIGGVCSLSKCDADLETAYPRVVERNRGCVCRVVEGTSVQRACRSQVLNCRETPVQASNRVFNLRLSYKGPLKSSSSNQNSHSSPSSSASAPRHQPPNSAPQDHHPPSNHRQCVPQSGTHNHPTDSG